MKKGGFGGGNPGTPENNKRNSKGCRPLTDREKECLELLANGCDNSEIAGALGIALPTVAMHLLNSRKKLEARTREHAVALAVAAGLIVPTDDRASDPEEPEQRPDGEE